MSALADMAKLAGVSKSSASRVFSGRGTLYQAACETVADGATRLGFVVSSAAESLAKGCPHNIDVCGLWSTLGKRVG